MRPVFNEPTELLVQLRAVVDDKDTTRQTFLCALTCWAQVQEYRRIEAAMGMELSGVAVQSTPWPYLLHQGKLLQGSLSDMPWGNNTFDVVFSHEVLEHIAADQVPACCTTTIVLFNVFDSRP